MRDLDEGPHRQCDNCGKLQPEPRCIEFNGRWYCGLNCKLKAERSQDVQISHRFALLSLANRRTGK